MRSDGRAQRAGDPQESPATIEQHRIDYGYTVPALRDIRHELIAMTAARVTPEAAVFDASGSMAYRGRLDNRYLDYDRKRTAPTQRDVADVLEQLLAGNEVIPPCQNGRGLSNRRSRSS